MQSLGRRYRDAGCGRSFLKWICDDNPLPYGSYGNGLAMRVSPCGYAAESIEEAKQLSEMVTKISHDHPDRDSYKFDVSCQGSVPEAFYGVPENMIFSAIEFLDSCEFEILYYFEKEYPSADTLYQEYQKHKTETEDVMIKQEIKKWN